MYTYVKSQCLSRSIGSQWSETDISFASLYAVFSTYTKVYLTLYNTVLEREVYVDLNTQRTEFGSFQGTLNEWLVLLGNRALPEIDSVPDGTVKFVKYGNATRAQYKMNLAQIGHNHPPGYPQELLDDVEITRPAIATDLSRLHTHCLVTAGGYIHATDTDGTRLFVRGAGKLLRKTGNNHIGIMSFLDVGALQKVHLDPDHIGRLEDDVPLTSKTQFTVDTDLEGKSVLMVVGGYLVLPQEGVFWKSGDQTFTIVPERLKWMERYMESRKSLDLSSLGLEPSVINPDVVAMEDLWQDETVKAYLTLDQSFLVVVDIAYMAFNKIELRRANAPGHFTSYQDPAYPLVVGIGKMAEYWKTEEAGAWSVEVMDNFYRHLVISQQAPSFMGMANDHMVPSRPVHLSRGYLLEIAGYPNV